MEHLTETSIMINTDVIIGGQLHPYFILPSCEPRAQNMHFTGANGFPAAVYGSFLQQFAPYYSISAADCRGALKQRSKPPKNFDLSSFAADLIQVIEAKNSQPVIAMGHSFGAHVSLLAAIKRPDLFTKLVLIEPASLPNAHLDRVYRKLPRFIVNKMVPMIKRTAERQQVWSSRESFVAKYRNHPTFRHLTDDAMYAYAQHGLNQQHDGLFSLVFDPAWEAHIFSQVEYIWSNLVRSNVPVLFLKAEHSNLYTKAQFQRENRRMGEHFHGQELANTHHLLPLENPEQCAQAVLDWLA